jgi:hypothetical protein
VYLLFIIPWSLKDVGCTKKGHDSHLVWDWNQNKYRHFVYGIFVICMSLMAYKGLGTLPALYVLLTYAITHLVYPSSYSISSLWCFFVVLSPLIYMLKK